MAGPRQATDKEIIDALNNRTQVRSARPQRSSNSALKPRDVSKFNPQPRAASTAFPELNSEEWAEWGDMY